MKKSVKNFLTFFSLVTTSVRFTVLFFIPYFIFRAVVYFMYNTEMSNCPVWAKNINMLCLIGYILLLSSGVIIGDYLSKNKLNEKKEKSSENNN
jgi:uncharacterized membrane protein (DUF485 family)